MHLVLFDVDGTLVDSQHMIVAAMNRAFTDVGLAAPARSATLSVVGLSLDEAMTELAGAAIEPSTVRALGEAYKAAYFALRARGDVHEPLYPGARAAHGVDVGRLRADDLARDGREGPVIVFCIVLRALGHDVGDPATGDGDGDRRGSPMA